MADIPSKIAETYERLKKEYPFYISLKRINGKYYLYKQFSRADKETGKTKVTSTYLGRVAEDGAFIKKSASEEDLIENAKAIIIANGGKVIMPEKAETNNLPTQTPSEIDKKILMILSMNARASLSFIGKKIGLTPAAVYNRVKQLEKIYHINYTIELNLDKLGYNELIVFVKFLNKKPTADDIKKATINVPNVQLVATLNGKYDLLIYLLAKGNENISTIVNLIRDNDRLSTYQTEWYISYFYGHYNFVVLRDEFIDVLKNELKEREYYLLKEFNTNSNTTFTDIDKKYGLEKGRTDYAYYGLKGSGVLKRSTINIQNNQTHYLGLVCASITKADKFIKNRKLLLSDIISDAEGVLSKYVLAGDIGIPKGVALIVPIFKNGDLEIAKEQLNHLDLGATIETSIITNVILGSFCFRKFDSTYTKQYDALVKDYKIQERPIINYDEPSKKSKVVKDIRGVIVNTENDDET